MGVALLLLIGLHAQDPVQVRSRLNDQEIEAGQTTVLRVDVETDGERARIHAFRALPPGIELVSTRDYDQRQFSLPGGVRRFVTREFVLRGRAAGRYRIPAVRVDVEGLTYSSESHLLTVTSGPDPVDAAGGAPSGVRLRAWMETDTAFVGEQVPLQVQAMFSQDARLRLRRSPEYHPPSPSGFWIHDLPDSRSPVPTTVGGDVYEVQTFRRALFPLGPGRHEIPPARLEYEMRRGLLHAPETFTVESDTLTLVVLPPPAEGQPPAFRGAVGQYTARGRIEPDRVPAGEAVVLTVEVTGTGNIKGLPPPPLPEMPGVDIFPPTEEAEVRVEDYRVRGTKRFSWVVIPRESGELEIPAISFVYFDPEERRYETARVEALALEVGPAGSAVTPVRADLRLLEREPHGGDPLAFVRSPWFLAAQAVPLLLVLAALVLARSRADGAPSRRGLRRRLKQGIATLEQQAAGGDRALFGEADRFARQWLADRLGVPAGRAVDPGILAEAGVPTDTARSLRQVLDRIASARYAPVSPGLEARRDLVRALGRVLERVDGDADVRRADPARARPAGGGSALTLLMVLLLAGATAPGTVSGQRPTPAEAAAFEQGVQQFDAGQYDRAVRSFQRYVRLRPDDPAGWYDLGLAHHRAGARGHATLAWLRVLGLDPRHPEARHNLRITGTAPELVTRATPPLRLRSEEAALLAGVLWLLSGVGISWWVLRRHRLIGVAGITSTLLAGFLAVIAIGSTDTPATLIVLEPAPLRTGPTLRSERLQDLSPGTGLVPGERERGWQRARTLQGREGWIDPDAVAQLGTGT